MKLIKKKKVVVLVLVLIMVLMSVGYSLGSANLKVTGTGNIDSNFSIEVTGIKEDKKEGKAVSVTAPTYTKTTASFNTKLSRPGDSIEYAVTVQNKGTVDGKINNITITNPNTLIKVETRGIIKGEILKSGETKNYIVRVYLEDDVKITNDVTSTISVSTEIIQDDNQIFNNGFDGVLTEKLEITTTSETANYTSITGTVSAKGVGLKYYYSLDGTTWTSASTTNSHTFTGLTPGERYTVYYKVEDSDGNYVTESKWIDTTVLPAPTIEILSNDNWGISKDVKITYATVSGAKYYYKVEELTDVEEQDEGTGEGSDNLEEYTEVTGTTTLTLTKNSIVYAKIVKDDKSADAEKEVTNIDSADAIINATTAETANSISIVVDAETESGISKYEFSIDDGITWIDTGKYNTHIFKNLTHGTEYTIKLRLTSNSGIVTESTVTATTNLIAKPTFEYTPGVTVDVTIIYPEGCGEIYTCSYIKNPDLGGTEEIVSESSTVVHFVHDGYLTAIVKDGINVESDTLEIDTRDADIIIPEDPDSAEDPYVANRTVYEGSNPSNYITFGGEEAGWRILALEPDGTLKIIKDSPLAVSGLAWDARTSTSAGPRLATSSRNTYCIKNPTDNVYYGCNVYGSVSGTVSNGNNCFEKTGSACKGTVSDDSTVATYLNGTYFNGLVDNNLVVDYVYNIGPINGAAAQKDLPTLTAQAKMVTWTGKVGLISVPEYLQANSNHSLCHTQISNNNNATTCKSTNWLVNTQSISSDWWTISMYWNYVPRVWRISTSGSILYYAAWSTSYAFRPVVHLSNTVKLEGTGTQTDPFRILNKDVTKPSINIVKSNGTADATITFNGDCKTEFTCKYQKNNESVVTTTSQSVTVNYTTDGTIKAQVYAKNSDVLMSEESKNVTVAERGPKCTWSGPTSSSAKNGYIKSGQTATYTLTCNTTNGSFTDNMIGPSNITSSNAGVATVSTITAGNTTSTSKTWNVTVKAGASTGVAKFTLNDGVVADASSGNDSVTTATAVKTDNNPPNCNGNTFSTTAATTGNVTVKTKCYDTRSLCVNDTYSKTYSANGTKTVTIADNLGNSRTCTYTVSNIYSLSVTSAKSAKGTWETCFSETFEDYRYQFNITATGYAVGSGKLCYATSASTKTSYCGNYPTNKRTGYGEACFPSASTWRYYRSSACAYAYVCNKANKCASKYQC